MLIISLDKTIDPGVPEMSRVNELKPIEDFVENDGMSDSESGVSSSEFAELLREQVECFRIQKANKFALEVKK
jgi:hypothetical protein